MIEAIVIADVLLHLAGINVVSDSVPGDCGIKIIVPRIHYVSPVGTQERRIQNNAKAKAAPAPHHAEAISLAGGIAIPLHDVKHVQDHEPLLIFRTSSLLAALNWPKVDLTGADAGWSYVKLGGDYIRFQANVSDVPATLAQVRLPRMKNELCPVMTGLKPEYQPPYRGAAAVFDIHQGALKSCMATTRSGSGRLDTELRVKSNAGVFTVSASTMTTTKELRFRVTAGADLELIAANVPAAYLQGNYNTPATTALDGIPHYMTYYAMGTGPTGSCTTSLNDWLNSMGGTSGFPACEMLAFANVAGKNTQLGKVANATTSSNFECSNSQWP